VNTTPAPRQVICPTCLDRFPWDESELLEYSVKEGRYQPIDLTGISNPVKRRDIRSRCYVRCPNPSKDAGESHYLPVTYVDYEDPLFVALAGRPRSGKTHLLVALVNQLVNGSASVCGLSATAVDTRLHADFKRRLLTPFRRGEQLPGTGDELGRYAAWLLIETPQSRRPVVFFDVAGEDFRNVGERGRNTRFLTLVTTSPKACESASNQLRPPGTVTICKSSSPARKDISVASGMTLSSRLQTITIGIRRRLSSARSFVRSAARARLATRQIAPRLRTRLGTASRRMTRRTRARLRVASKSVCRWSPQPHKGLCPMARITPRPSDQAEPPIELTSTRRSERGHQGQWARAEIARKGLGLWGPRPRRVARHDVDTSASAATERAPASSTRMV
jgi:hypothetical protein